MDLRPKDTRDTRKRTKSSITPQQLIELGKLPPQAVDLEEAVLGALMLDKDALSNVIDIVKPESFYKEAHQRIFSAIQNLFTKAEPVDILTVTQELKRTGELEIAGGAFYVTQLTNRIASSANVEMHARIVLEKYLQRELIRISTDTLQHAYEDTSDVFDLLNIAEQNLFSISQTNIRKDFEHIQPILGRSIHEIEAARNHQLSGVQSGFTSLDRITGGWQRSDLIILAARPGTGKTALHRRGGANQDRHCPFDADPHPHKARIGRPQFDPVDLADRHARESHLRSLDQTIDRLLEEDVVALLVALVQSRDPDEEGRQPGEQRQRDRADKDMIGFGFHRPGLCP